MCVCVLQVTWRANGIVLYMYEGKVLMDNLFVQVRQERTCTLVDRPESAMAAITAWVGWAATTQETPDRRNYHNTAAENTHTMITNELKNCRNKNKWIKVKNRQEEMK